MSVERRSPAVHILLTTLGGRGEMTKASISLQDLRRKMYLKAKSEKTWRFWGLETFLEQIRNELQSETYQPMRNRRKEISKGNGKVRVLGIPSICDRVVQGALKLILEPIFEADGARGSYTCCRGSRMQ